MSDTISTTIVLENAALRAEFSLETGALLSLKSMLTGWIIHRRPEPGVSFRMLAPIANMRNNPVLGEKQRVSRYAVAKDGNAVTFTWEALHSEHGGELPITFTGTATLRDDGLTFTGSISNRSEYPVEAIAYPCLGDVTPATPESKLERYTQGYGGGGPSELYPKFSETEGYWGTCSPVNSTSNHGSQFMLLQNSEQGLYIGYHDPDDARIGRLYLRISAWLPGLLHFPGAEDGDHQPAYRTPGDAPGTLPLRAAGRNNRARSYRAAALCRPLAERGGYLQGMARHLVHASGQHPGVGAGHPFLAAIPHARPGRYHPGALSANWWRSDASARRHGIAAIQLVGWNDGGQDRGNPSHNTDAHLGSWEELRDAITMVQAMGVKIILFNKYTWVDLSSAWYEHEGFQHVTRDPYGGIHWANGYEYQTMTQLAGINTRRFAVTCTASPAWRKTAVGEFLKSVQLGAAGMLFDEAQHHGSATHCFSRGHHHHHPAFLCSADNQLAREFRAASDPVDAEYLFAGEGLNDYQLLEYHLSYFRISEGNATHMHRYIDPFAPLMVASRGFDDRNSLNKCLQYRYIISFEPFNFKGRPEDFPLTLEYGKKINALRRQYRAYLWDAEFRDVIGAAVTVAGQPYRDYTLFRRLDTGKRAVIVANLDPEQSLTATITLDGEHGPLSLVDPENPIPRESDGTVVIPPRSVAVVLEGEG